MRKLLEETEERYTGVDHMSIYYDLAPVFWGPIDWPSVMYGISCLSPYIRDIEKPEAASFCSMKLGLVSEAENSQASERAMSIVWRLFEIGGGGPILSMN